MFQIENLLLYPITTLVPCHTPPLMPDVDICGKNFGLNDRVWFHRNRIEVGAHAHASIAVYGGEALFGQRELFTDGRQEMIVLDSHSFTNGLRAVPNPPCLIVPAALQ